MADRGITEGEVEYCLNEPEIIRSGEGGTVIHAAHPNGRFIKIVVPRMEPTVIITAAD